MRTFLLYKDVQRHLNTHMEEFGTPISFYDAVTELWKEKRYHTAPELPSISFEEWDCRDMEAFCALISETPVEMELFRYDIQLGKSVLQSSRRVPQMDVLPLKIAENQAMGIHKHESFEMLYVLQGQARLSMGKSRCIIRDFLEGELCLVAPHFPHDVTVEGHSVVISILFSETTIEETLYRLLKSENAMSNFFRASLNQGSSGYLLSHMDPTDYVRFLICNIFHESYIRQAYSDQILIDLIEILFSRLLRECANSWERYSEDRDRSGPPLIPIMQYIQANYRTASLQDVARRFHYEPSYLGKLIRTHTGRNYTQIAGELRIEEAKRLLCVTKENIEKVAELAGFQSAIHFSRSFRQHTGMTPRQYRKQAEGKN